MAKITSICVYCGSNSGSPIYQRLAEELGRIMAENGVGLVFGGGTIGLMGILARQVKAHGGIVTGVIPEHLNRVEVAFEAADRLHVVPDMHFRKRKMFELADAFLVLPGGLGTLDETIEMLTWAQLGLHSKPIVILNYEAYWDPLLALFDHVIEEGFAGPASRDLYIEVSSIEEILPAMNNWPAIKKRSEPPPDA
ncbi:MAG: TIGR00730 family Rossman fold protein [Sphingomonadales bacterium]